MRNSRIGKEAELAVGRFRSRCVCVCGRAMGGGGLQSHEGDVSTCHIVVITCAAVAARLIIVTIIRGSSARDYCGRRECGSCSREERQQITYRLDFRLKMLYCSGNVRKHGPSALQMKNSS